MSSSSEDAYSESPTLIGPRIPSSRDLAAIRKLLPAMEAAAQAREQWPTMDCDTPDRDWRTGLEHAHDYIGKGLRAFGDAMIHLIAEPRNGGHFDE